VYHLNPRVRRRLIGIAIACVAVELTYVVAASLLLRGDTLERVINRKPEKFRIEFTGARSWLPGVVSVERLTLHGQSRTVQWYLERTRSAGASACGASRPRPCTCAPRTRPGSTSGCASGSTRRRSRARTASSGRGRCAAPSTSRRSPASSTLRTPGRRTSIRRRRPSGNRGSSTSAVSRWTAGARRGQPHADRGRRRGHRRDAVPHRESVEVRRADLRWKSARLLIDSEVAIDDLALDVSSRWRPFPAKGARLQQILGGISGRVAIACTLRAGRRCRSSRAGAADRGDRPPGDDSPSPGRRAPAWERLDPHFRRPAHRAARLTAAGTARLAATTGAGTETPRTDLAIDLASFALFDPADAASASAAPASSCGQRGTACRSPISDPPHPSRSPCRRPRSATWASSAPCCRRRGASTSRRERAP